MYHDHDYDHDQNINRDRARSMYTYTYDHDCIARDRSIVHMARQVFQAAAVFYMKCINTFDMFNKKLSTHIRYLHPFNIPGFLESAATSEIDCSAVG